MTTTGGMETGSAAPGPEPPKYRGHRSIAGPLFLIILGVLFLLGTIRPDFDPWWVIWTYWPVLLIFLGLGQIADYYWNRNPDGSRSHAISGTGVAWIILLIILIFAGWHGGGRWRADRTSDWGWGHGWDARHDWGGGHNLQETQSIELQGAKKVSADLDIPAGEVTITGGSGKLLDASFDYDDSEGKPTVDYSVSGDHGQLNITQEDESHTHWGGRQDIWNLRFGSGVPLDLKMNMGAGQSNLQMSQVNLSRLELHMGAGELHLDLTGPRTTDLDATIQGGVGSATIRLPKNVGVRVDAHGGIGSVNAPGLERDGDAYVNAAYGKTPATINLSVEGGVGEINLYTE
ncbi:MAG TPA: toast rack family protein [Candidatus Baltobacteraceae bacterium]|nr:toast rack family protein [Candidatus Baltobacteraceae bacterium]